ncbi:hypothetical protein DSO57_1022380 [Entomophthora muscae]|uniref:Uncharacterized protein n=1 Tax=Entomophthora muscae TaxID=34485 RepID=A0ACC2UP26_9FUNG|nr:hypothetical protein DSO57_1022380 [Entomophthora muscae]
MGPVLNPEPNFLRPASSEDQELGCLKPINSKPVSKVDANLPGSESSPSPQRFSSKLPVPDDRSFPKVTTCNTGSLGGEISNPTNEKSPKPAPVLRLDNCSANPSNTIASNDNPPTPNARSFPEVLSGIFLTLSKLPYSSQYGNHQDFGVLRGLYGNSL